MGKATFLAAVLLAPIAGLPAAAMAQDAAPPPCEISIISNERLQDAVDGHTETLHFNGYDGLCQRLAQEGFGLKFDDNSGIEAERTFGWVSVAMFDLATEITSPARQTTISLTADLREEDKAAMLVESLRAAMGELAQDQDLFVASLRREIDAVRQAVAPQ